MSEPKEKKVTNQPTVTAQESPESMVNRLTADNERLRKLAEKTINENQVLRATVKALAQLI